MNGQRERNHSPQLTRMEMLDVPLTAIAVSAINGGC